MPGFNYTAYDANGDIVSGEIEAESKTAAMEMLALQDMIPDKVKETKEGGTRGFSLFGVKSGDLILYAKQFRTLIAAGIGIIQVFNVLEVQTENRVLKRATAEMMKAIEKGDTLFKAFSAQSHAFSGLFCAMVRAGETSGTLPDVLERLIYITEHEEKVKNDIRAALRYPVIVMCFLLTSFIVLLTMVVPKFVGIFERAGIALPLPTQICIALYRFMDQYWPMIILATAGTILFLIRFAKTPGGRLIFHSLMLRMPIIGPVLVKSAMSRFASIFSILQASRITVLDAMTILANTINNAAIEREL
ncbi:MAG: type II secretion system F family protein, partial [Desulfobacterales bacterium]|nr:type II secretion system F family protein [Desulfobacterales bacterium]